MDYEGNYFPEDEEENTSKKGRVIKKILRYALYSLVAIVYIAVFAVILNNCEPKMYEKYVFSPAANELYNADPDGFEFYEMFPTKFMNYDGSVQIAGVGYAKTAGELEIGIKYNKRLENKETGFKPSFVLTDTNGNSYEICNVVTDSQGRYNYVRISFKGVELPIEDNVYINPEVSEEVEGEGEMFETFKYKLKIYKEDTDKNAADIDNGDDPKGSKGAETITIFNNITPIQRVKFN